MKDDHEVLVIGAGAAGIGAARRLREAGRDCLLLEARHRVGGRALTAAGTDGMALDLGCEWLHSADRNPFVAIAESFGFHVDHTRPPWARSLELNGLTDAETRAFAAAQEELDERLEGFAAEDSEDRPVSDFLGEGGRWTPMLEAISTYYSGARTAAVSAKDLDLYEDTGLNWRVREGYGRLIERCAQDLPVAFGCLVHGIEHGGTRLRVHSSRGVLTADAVVLTLPTRLIAEDAIRFDPPLREKREAAEALPLGLAEKLFLELSGEDFAPDSRAFGATDRMDTGAYHFRPGGSRRVECYFGGELTRRLAKGGPAAFFDFARSELTGLFGEDFAKRIQPLPMHVWQSDPLSGGSYSYARPGAAKMRGLLARPVEDRLFFAGEATSRRHFSTAHGAWLSGVRAAEEVLAARSDGATFRLGR